MIKGFITREEALAAENDMGQAIRPSDVLPSEKQVGRRYAEQIRPLYAAWLICNLDVLRYEGWPDLPRDDVWTDRTGRPHNAMETPLVFAAEISTRLDRCGRDGRVCLAYYKNAWTIDSIVENWGTFGNHRRDRSASPKSVSYMVKNALLYCSGRRKGPYHEWLARRRNRVMVA